MHNWTILFEQGSFNDWFIREQVWKILDKQDSGRQKKDNRLLSHSKNDHITMLTMLIKVLIMFLFLLNVKLCIKGTTLNKVFLFDQE